MLLKPEHLGVAASDATALKDWFVRVLDARVLRQLGDTPPAFLLEMPGGFWIEVYSAESKLPPQGNRVAGWRHLALRVDNLDAARQQLVAKHVTFEEPVKPAGGGGRVLFFADPEGNLYHLVERPAGWQASAA